MSNWHVVVSVNSGLLLSLILSISAVGSHLSVEDSLTTAADQESNQLSEPEMLKSIYDKFAVPGMVWVEKNGQWVSEKFVYDSFELKPRTGDNVIPDWTGFLGDFRLDPVSGHFGRTRNLDRSLDLLEELIAVDDASFAINVYTVNRRGKRTLDHTSTFRLAGDGKATLTTDFRNSNYHQGERFVTKHLSLVPRSVLMDMRLEARKMEEERKRRVAQEETDKSLATIRRQNALAGVLDTANAVMAESVAESSADLERTLDQARAQAEAAQRQRERQDREREAQQQQRQLAQQQTAQSQRAIAQQSAASKLDAKQ